MTALTAALTFGLVLVTLGYLLVQWQARKSWTEPPRIVVVHAKRFDTDTARAELVSDELLAVAVAAGVVPEQRRAGVES